MKRNIKLEIESHDYQGFINLLGESVKTTSPAIMDYGLPTMVVQEWFEGRFVRIMQTAGFARQNTNARASRSKTWPEKFSQAEGTAFMLVLRELPLPIESTIHLIRNNLLDQLYRQLLPKE